MDRRRLNKLNDNMDPIPIFALHKQMTIVLNNLKLIFANKYQAHVFFFSIQFCLRVTLTRIPLWFRNTWNGKGHSETVLNPAFPLDNFTILERG